MHCHIAAGPRRVPACRLAAGGHALRWLVALGMAAALAPAVGADRNVYAAGGHVRPDGPVDGDFTAAGGRVVVDQAVHGDVTAAGGAVELLAPVGDDLRAAGGNVRIAATVGGEALAAGGDVLLASGARIGRGASLYGGSVRVDGAVDGPLTVRARRVSVHGEVGGDADLGGEQVELGPGARIAGSLRYTSPNEIVRAAGAAVAGPVTRVPSDGRDRDERAHGPRRGGWADAAGRGDGWIVTLLGYAAVLASGALLLLVFPRFAADASQALRGSPGRALLFGALALVAVPLLAVLLFITLLGIPLAVALLALYPPLLLGGYVVGVHFIAGRAEAALRTAGRTASAASTIGFFALALLLLTLLGRLPLVGGLAVACVAVLGVGAGVLAVRQRRQAGHVAAAPPTA